MKTNFWSKESLESLLKELLNPKTKLILGRQGRKRVQKVLPVRFPFSLRVKILKTEWIKKEENNFRKGKN